MIYTGDTTSISSQAVTKFQVLDTFIYDQADERIQVVLCHHNNKLWFTTTEDLREDFRAADPESWEEPLEIDLETIHPRYRAWTMTKVDNLLDEDTFIKRPNYLGILNSMQLDMSLLQFLGARLIMREVRICELLKRNPHPNVATYYGVEASNTVRAGDATVGIFEYEIVTGVCFERYDCTLDDLVLRKQYIDIEKTISDISAGIAHIHSLGFVHCDIKPANIFYKNGVFVVGDFDSVHRVHAELDLRMGTEPWYDCKVITQAEFEHDFEALRRIGEWLREEEVDVKREPSFFPVKWNEEIGVERYETTINVLQAFILFLLLLVLPTRYWSFVENVLGPFETISPYLRMPPAPHNTRIVVTDSTSQVTAGCI